MASLVNITSWSIEEMKKYIWIDTELLNKIGVKREFQSSWQAYKYLLNGKMFAYIGNEDRINRPIITLKLDPMFSDILRKQYVDIVEGYYMNKFHWSTVYLDGKVSKSILKDIIESSYQWAFSSLSQKAQKTILENS